MIRLDATNRKLQAVLAGAITTSQLPCTVSYSDKTSTDYVGATQLTNTNSTTQVDICAAPAASTVRDIDYVSIKNVDTAAATVSVIYDDNTTDYTIAKCVLAVGDQLTYTHGTGWQVIASDGTLKTGSGLADGDKGDITVSSSGATWTVDNAAVTLAKMANLAQDQFIGRTTASTGVPETATITAAARTVLDDTTVGAMLTTLGAASLAANTFTGIQRWAKGADVASANALTLGTDGNYFDITGTTAVTSIGTLGVGTWVKLHFDGILTFTHHATDLILPGAANITTAAGDEIELVEYATGDWRMVGGVKANGTAWVGGTTTRQVFTASGTYTAPAGLKAALIEVVGGGGAGGGPAATGAGLGSGAGGGGGGGYARKYVSAATIGASQTVTIGAGGTIGSAGAAGNAGGTTSFGAIVTATGGSGGSPGTASGGSQPDGDGGIGGAGVSGDLNSAGDAGGMGHATSAGGYNRGGKGGASALGGGGREFKTVTTTTGAAGGVYGGGASGGANGQSQSANSGSAGAIGVCFVTEFY